MESSAAIDLVSQSLIVALIIAAPILVIGLMVGLVISILQAVTQLQEQTLSFVPKIVAMTAAAMFFLPWLTTRTLEYAQELWSSVGAAH